MIGQKDGQAEEKGNKKKHETLFISAYGLVFTNREDAIADADR